MGEIATVRDISLDLYWLGLAFTEFKLRAVKFGYLSEKKIRESYANDIAEKILHIEEDILDQAKANHHRSYQQMQPEVQILSSHHLQVSNR